jgi:hypothetical protein
MRLNYFGKDRINIELLDRRQLNNLTVSILVAYFIIILCGTLGAPRQVASHSL